MSLIMDALKRAQRLRLTDRQVPPFLDSSRSLEEPIPAPRGKRVPLLLLTVVGLAAILSGFILFHPFSLLRHEKGRPTALPPSKEKPVHVASSNEENRNPLFPESERPQVKKEALLAERTEKRKGPQNPSVKPKSSQKSKGFSGDKASSGSFPKEEPPIEEISTDGKGTLDLSRPSPSPSASLHSLFNQGVRHQSQGQLEKAVEAYLNVLEMDPFYYEAYNNLGLLYQEQGDSKRAVEAFKKALEIRPNYVKALNNLGILCYLEERYDEALDCFEHALSASPNHVESHLHLGLVLKKRGQSDKALEAFEKALRLDPLHGESHYNLALLLEETQRIDEAIEHYERFIEIASRTHPVLAARVANHLFVLRRMKRE